MWTWISEDAGKADRMLREVLAPLLRRDPDTLRDQVCVGPAGRCAELLRRYADAGCERVYLWPLGDEPQQIGSRRQRCCRPLRSDQVRAKACGWRAKWPAQSSVQKKYAVPS
jgi:hypothetical protein